ncbi:MAG: FixH family protein [Thiobacillaceae bacterium]|jgi:nitrogen fixation protein FixH|nr:FixH family protein [Thiobacillaceae bacterium]
MNLLVTLFGGMLLTALLYGVGRLGRLSNFWSAVAACALPTFAYLAYAVARWTGLDVVTMHVVAFPTVALLLYMLYGSKARHAETMHWAPKLMVAFFLFISVVLGSFVYIASQGLPPAVARLLLPGAEGRNIHTGFSGVVTHREEAAKGIAHHLNIEDRLNRLGWRVEVDGLGGVQAGATAPLRVLIRDRSGRGVDGVAVSLRLARPGQKADATLAFEALGEGAYQAALPPLERGTWVAYLGLRGDDGRPLVLEHGLEVR